MEKGRSQARAGGQENDKAAKIAKECRYFEVNLRPK
jgi:hypothetical protein